MKKTKQPRVSTFDPSEEDYTESGTPEQRAYAESVIGISIKDICGEDGSDDEESESQPDDAAAELSERDAEKREAAKPLPPPINPPPTA